ncbi:MAG: glutamyl-Q tRNA(Asp) synthetase [Yoonia sp.]|jgi:glutamyl-Q tRNA(Asp) synthetase
MITRFAPSPTGPLHLGHAYSAMVAYDMAMAANGTFLLRIEDIDQTRARPQWESQIYDDLRWLGLHWPDPVLRQSDRLSKYQSVIRTLWSQGLIYRCSCNRKDILGALSAPQEGAPLLGPDGVVYPGTCRNLVARCGSFPTGAALRLDMTKICKLTDTSAELAHTAGDIVISRRDMGTSYHLSVVMDDADQGVTDVVRGQDLEDATPIHILLQKILGLQTPIYHHHKLIRDENGKRLAKRDDARALSKYRVEGATPNDIRRLVGLPEG